MSDTVPCKFSKERACETPAHKFVRNGQSKRLIPLCDRCLTTFEEAYAKIKGAEGGPSKIAEVPYDLVAVADGMEEWRKQGPATAQSNASE